MNAAVLQGALLQAPDESWWYLHQLIQNCDHPFQGRTQMLEPVEWIDGWPLIGKDVNGDGIGEPVIEYKKPVEGYPIMRPQTDDEFDRPTLGHQWEWNHNPRVHSLVINREDGALATYCLGTCHAGGSRNACNTISQRVMGIGNGDAEPKIDISGMAIGQKAGFVRFGGNLQYDRYPC